MSEGGCSVGLRVKKLEWRKPDTQWSFSQCWESDAFEARGYFIALDDDGKWSWWTTWDGEWEMYPSVNVGDSLDECQRQCQAHWESAEGIGQCLEFIPCSMDSSECTDPYESSKAASEHLLESMKRIRDMRKRRPSQ